MKMIQYINIDYIVCYSSYSHNSFHITKTDGPIGNNNLWKFLSDNNEFTGCGLVKSFKNKREAIQRIKQIPNLVKLNRSTFNTLFPYYSDNSRFYFAMK